MTEAPKSWMPREQWDALLRGENCPACAECQATEQRQEHGYIVADLRLSRLRLALNQYVPGYCVLLCHRHVQEPYHLTDEEYALFFEDMKAAARALEQVFKPIKMNFNILGNLVPHLHVHILPRYYNDPAPGRPIDPGAQVVTLTVQEYQDRVRLIQAALASLEK